MLTLLIGWCDGTAPGSTNRRAGKTGKIRFDLLGRCRAAEEAKARLLRVRLFLHVHRKQREDVR